MFSMTNPNLNEFSVTNQQPSDIRVTNQNLSYIYVTNKKISRASAGLKIELKFGPMTIYSKAIPL
jgi:hypothetical protein